MTSIDEQPLPDTRKRFVAGAKCPQCQALDKIVMFRKAGVQHQACVSCGYHAEMGFEQNFRELETRVNRTETDKVRDVSPIKFV
ncbi:MAG: YheV family putative zinc ribbon protein [Pseudomonadales bacterium]